MFELLYVNGMIEVISDNTAVARLFKNGDNYLVKCLFDGYDTTADSLDTAQQIIKMRMER